MKTLLILLVACVGVSLACNGGSDCGDNECCVISANGNVCQPLAAEGEECHVMEGIFPLGKPEHPVTQCPCAISLSCLQDDGAFAQLGSKGTCQMLLLS